MKNNKYVRQAEYKKGFAVPLVIIIIVLLIAGGTYLAIKSKNAPTNTNLSTTPSPSTEPNSTSTPAVSSTYTNHVYNFTFQYPSTWKITEDTNGKSVRVESDKTVLLVPDKPITEYSITFTGIKNTDFGEQNTKVGAIRFDASQKALVDVSVTPPRCLAVQYYTPGSVPSISYGGSMMSDPAHFESAILTNKDYMILVAELSESQKNKGREQILSSFKFINEVKTRIPGCVPDTITAN